MTGSIDTQAPRTGWPASSTTRPQNCAWPSAGAGGGASSGNVLVGAVGAVVVVVPPEPGAAAEGSPVDSVRPQVVRVRVRVGPLGAATPVDVEVEASSVVRRIRRAAGRSPESPPVARTEVGGGSSDDAAATTMPRTATAAIAANSARMVVRRATGSTVTDRAERHHGPFGPFAARNRDEPAEPGSCSYGASVE